MEEPWKVNTLLKSVGKGGGRERSVMVSGSEVGSPEVSGKEPRVGNKAVIVGSPV